MFVFIASFLMYLCLSWGGDLSAWEVTAALALSFLVTLVAPGTRLNFGLTKGLSPFRWWFFLRHFFGPLASGFSHAAFETAYRIATGDVRPSLIKIQPRLRGDIARMLLANTLTLTSGVLTVDVDEDGSFYLHLLCGGPEGELEVQNLCAVLSNWARRVAE